MSSEQSVDRTRVATWLMLVTVLAVAVGLVGAVVWSRATPLPTYLIGDDGGATITETDLGQIFAADAWFTLIGAVGGLVLGAVSWWRFRILGIAVPLIALGEALLAGLVCWQVGALLGPGPLAARLTDAKAGDRVPVALELHAVVALAVWAIAAVAVVLVISAFGPDEASQPTRRRRDPMAEPTPPENAVDDLGNVMAIPTDAEETT